MLMIFVYIFLTLLSEFVVFTSHFGQADFNLLQTKAAVYLVL
jgi:hypothetical protein